MDSDAISISDALPFAGEPSPWMDFDRRAERFKRAAILRSRRAYYLSRRPPSCAYFDINHKDLQPWKKQIDHILNWKVNPKGLIASGKTGRGKTRAMFWLCKRLLCKEGVDVAIWNAQEFFAELQLNLRFGRDEAGDFVKRQAARPVLFIDDYGQDAVKAGNEEWAQGWFLRLLDMRLGNGLPLLMTTNQTAQEICGNVREVSSHPLVRRLTELAEGVRFV